jgi:hypothetical protein
MKKQKPQNKISDIDKQQLEAIYRVRPLLATGCYLTPIMNNKSTNVRITFSEYNMGMQSNIPVNAVVMSIEDVQNTYNAMTELLQQMRTLGRIE